MRFSASLARKVIFQVRPRSCSQAKLFRRLFWKSESRFNTSKDPSSFLSGLVDEVTFQVRPRSCPQEMSPRGFSEKVEDEFNTCKDKYVFCWVLQGRSLARSGPKVVYKKCVQMTFWQKWKAGPTPEGTYPVFVGSFIGGHFPGQAPKLFTRSVPKEHFGKSGEQVQHLIELI